MADTALRAAGARGFSEDRLVRGRIFAACAFVALLSVALLARLVYIQVIQHQRFSTLAQQNRISFVTLPPVRGLIYDRNGVLLAENFDVYNLEVLPSKVADMDALLAQLARWVEIGENDLRVFESRLRERPPFEWQTLRANLTEVEAARVAVNQHLYPGVELRARLQRHYPHAELTAHVLGYVNRINAGDLKKFGARTYRGLNYIGRSGIEAQYESMLLGSPGVGQIETNAHGRAVRSLDRHAPQAGRTLHLSLDIELQRRSMRALRGREGAIVALDPASGDVLAFAAAPAYDPNPFVNGISEASYTALNESEGQPLYNRALAGRYSPGSTIKAFVLLAAMEHGVDPRARHNCPGWYRLPVQKYLYHDWKRDGHGRVDGRAAIVQSCDVYFYRLAHELGIERMHSGLSQFGFGERTGIDLPGEPSGLVPSREWKRKVRGEAWFPGETVITGIGQGYFLTTPLQLAVAASTLANRGARITPRFLTAVENPQTQARENREPRIAARIALRDGAYQYAVDSMRDVVHSIHGTAHRISGGLRYKIAGKTGTVQVVRMTDEDRENEEDFAEKKLRDHALFIAFAPIEQPKIAIAVVIEHAGKGGGGGHAAPVARELIDFYLLEQLGMGEEKVARQ